MSGKLFSVSDKEAQDSSAEKTAAAASSSAPAFLDRILKIESEQLSGQKVKNAAATRSEADGP